MSLKIRIPESLFEELERANKIAYHVNYYSYPKEDGKKIKLIFTTDQGTVELLSTPDKEFTEERSEVVTKFKDITI